MADAKSSAAEEIKVDPIAARMFARRFTGVHLTFLSLRLRPTYTSSKVGLLFEGPGDRLLELGLIEPGMVPAKRKRQLHECFQQGEDEVWISVERKAKGWLRVRLDLAESLPADHVLAFLAPYNYPFAETLDEKRGQFMAEFERNAGFVLGFVCSAARSLVIAGVHGLQVDPVSKARIDTALTRFDTDLRAAVAAAGVQSPKRTNDLRLVVDNTRPAR